MTPWSATRRGVVARRWCRCTTSQLLTDLGPLDILCRLHDGRGYQELAQHSVAIEAGDLNLKVIDLPTLIEIKSSTGRVRDRLVVPLLLALLREREKPPQG